MLISVWLLACAFTVGGEFGDGYQTIINARYFYADISSYFVQRGPLAALALWPVEAIINKLGLSPVDVRPYHLYSALLHSLYLLGCWLLLKRSGQSFITRIIAFATAILSVVFFANAPYLSHDIIPGFVFLLFVFLCNRWIREPTVALALQLVVIGTAVTFIKQTYAIFWIAMCVYSLLAFLFKWNDGSVSLPKMLHLFALAGLSAVLSWFGYGWFIGGELPQVSLLERPMSLIGSVSSQYASEGGISSLFPWDIYVRNLHNYGIATMLLIIPGIVLAFRSGDARLRMVAVCWLISVIIMQSIGFKEVRYLAFLAPLSAMLILPVVSLAIRSRVVFPVLLVLVVVDQYRGLSMAAAQISSTPGMDVTRFVGEADNSGKIVSSRDMSFAFMANSPMQRDRYHGIFHLTGEQLSRLYEGRKDVRIMSDPRDLGVIGIEPGDRVLYSNRTLVRRPPWQDDNVPLGLEQALMSSGVATMINLNLSGDQFLIEGHDGKFVMFIPQPGSGKQMPLIASGKLPASKVKLVYGDSTGDALEVLGVVLDSLCQTDRCTYF